MKFHVTALLFANLLIIFLAVMASMVMKNTTQIVPTTLPSFELQLTTIELSMMLVRATLIIWEAVLIGLIVIEEYRSKTITLLYTYPYNRKKIIAAKLILICLTMLIFHMFSAILQNILIKVLSGTIGFVTYTLENVISQIIIMIATICLGLLPLCFGMIRKSVITTIISSLIIVCIASSSQGNTAGLISTPIMAIVLGAIGLMASAITVGKMCKEDLSV